MQLVKHDATKQLRAITGPKHSYSCYSYSAFPFFYYKLLLIIIVVFDWPRTFLQPDCFCLAYHCFL